MSTAECVALRKESSELPNEACWVDRHLGWSVCYKWTITADQTQAPDSQFLDMMFKPPWGALSKMQSMYIVTLIE